MKRRTTYQSEQACKTLDSVGQTRASQRRAVFPGPHLWMGLAVLLGAVGCTPKVQVDGEQVSGGGGQGGAGSACGSTADCQVAVPECRKAIACESGQCVFEDTAEGTPIAAQVPGDCQQRVCDGQGLTKSVAATGDIPDDGYLCTLDSCNGALPVHTLQMGVDVPCYTGLAGTAGVGICKAGAAHCDAQGQPGPCTGEIVPQPESCDAALIDEDCDGKINDEGANCVCGDGFVSVDIGEECDDGDTLDGPCSPTCKEQKVLDLDLGDYFTCALLSGGRVKCWGFNDYGRLGVGHESRVGDGPNEMGSYLASVNLGSGQTAVALSVGDTHACVLLQDGAVKCWGENYWGQLGLGDTNHRGDQSHEMGDNLPPVDLGTGKTAKAIVAGVHSTCALLHDDSIKCWGLNYDGSLGLGHKGTVGEQPNQMGDNLPPIDLGTGKTPTQLTRKGKHTCALFTDSSVKCWGEGDAALGLGEIGTRGDEPNEMGDFLPAVDLGIGNTAQAIAAGTHTCALLHNSALKCWGTNFYGQIGLGHTGSIGDQPNQMGDNLPAVDLGSGKTAVAISAGWLTTCALLSDGSVKCWGVGQYGALGLGDQEDRGNDPDEMGDNLPPVDLGTGKTATAVRTSGDHTCAILNDGAVKCWGHNGSGQLGLGDWNNRGKLPGEMGDALPTAKLFSDVW